MAQARVHAFSDDVLADHDATELAAMVVAREVTPTELADAAIRRAEGVRELHAVAYESYRDPLYSPRADGVFAGVPTFVKDNNDVAGMPTGNGSQAYSATKAGRHGGFVREFLQTGVTVLGKSAMPEYGFNASSEYPADTATRNPWRTTHSAGGSSSGAAALVAAGVVPIAHASDGGGSIRIPAACNGLFGLKVSRDRHADGRDTALLPIRLNSEGILSRTLRDTAGYVAAMEKIHRNTKLPPIGLVSAPGKARLRVGVVTTSVMASGIDNTNREAVEAAAGLLADAGHRVEALVPPVPANFVADFVLYWGMLAALASTTGPLIRDWRYDKSRHDGLTKGLAAHYIQNAWKTPQALYRLSRAPQLYAQVFQDWDVVITPVVAHEAPELGYLSPTLPFDTLIDRLMSYDAFAPLSNMAGSPALSYPFGLSPNGLPIGVHLMAASGGERVLLEVAYELSEVVPALRIQDFVS